MIETNFTKLTYLMNLLHKSSVVQTTTNFQHNTIILKGDSGATNQYVPNETTPMLDNIEIILQLM